MQHNMLYSINQSMCVKKRPISFTLLIVLSTNTKLLWLLSLNSERTYNIAQKTVQYLLFPKQTLVLTNLTIDGVLKMGNFCMGYMGGYGIADYLPRVPFLPKGPVGPAGKKGTRGRQLRNSISAQVTHAEISFFIVIFFKVFY